MNASSSFLAQHSQPELGATHVSRAHTNVALNRTSSSSSGVLPVRSSTLGVPGSRAKRNSAIGVASSPGRLYKVLGDFFLLAGRTEDASIWYLPLS